MTKQALELALEALEEPKEHLFKHRRLEAITAIKEALAQPDDKKCENCGEFGECCQNAQPEQEPVAFIDEQGALQYYKPSDFNQCEYGGLQRLYTTPPASPKDEAPQRKPLTDEQRREIAFRWRDGNGTASEIIDMVEAAHGIFVNPQTTE